MEIIVYILLGDLAALVLLLAVLVIRALAFKPGACQKTESEPVNFDGDAAANSLATLIRFKTVSSVDPSLEDDAEFEGLIAALPELYPKVYEVCELKRFDGRALLYRWRGRGDGQPAVLMAHYDVVPVNEDGWEVDPFSALIKDGVMWGRGTLDTKVTFNAILFSVNKLIAEGFTPENDVYLAFSGGEEVHGKGASEIVSYFEENGITPAFVMDEGGAVVENVFPGVKKPCALIGVAEKGFINLEFTAKSNGGHASAPKPHTPVGVLSQACVRLEKKPFKYHITPPVKAMFDKLGRESTFVYRLIFANLWCFAPVLDMICKKSGGDLNALMRTTVAFTQMEGSTAANVIPPHARMVANMRLNPYDTVDSAIEYVKKTVADGSIEVKALEANNPSRLSVTNTDGFMKIERAIKETWSCELVSQYLMVQCSDSYHWGRISDRVYRFSAMDLTSEERRTIHGHNERIRLDCLNRSVEFYIRLIKSV
ncbi:MAG: M20/M25/M40 family metallo-hydrolase [Clostridia bacterium]|nr:M20/M25/M40 family metallo-hydrolase [Clostridia bacterium]